MKITKESLQYNALKLLKATANSNRMIAVEEISKEDAIADAAYMLGVIDLMERLTEVLDA